MFPRRPGVIRGVTTVVLWDRDIQDGELAEAELAFHAQDNTGRVWGLGEYPASGHQQKFYAPGVGNIKVTAVDDPEGETLVLTKVVHLNPKGLASARDAALKLEERAYEVSKVYRSTPPMR